MAPSALQSGSPTLAPALTPRNLKFGDGKASIGTDNDIYGSYYPADPATLRLESNFGPMDPATVGYLQPTSADTPIEVMRQRFEKDGYLFVG